MQILFVSLHTSWLLGPRQLHHQVECHQPGGGGRPGIGGGGGGRPTGGGGGGRPTNGGGGGRPTNGGGGGRPTPNNTGGGFGGGPR